MLLCKTRLGESCWWLRHINMSKYVEILVVSARKNPNKRVWSQGQWDSIGVRSFGKITQTWRHQSVLCYLRWAPIRTHLWREWRPSSNKRLQIARWTDEVQDVSQGVWSMVCAFNTTYFSQNCWSSSLRQFYLAFSVSFRKGLPIRNLRIQTPVSDLELLPA